MKDKGMDRFTGNMRGEHVKRSRLSSGDQKQKKMEGQCLRRPGPAGRGCQGWGRFLALFHNEATPGLLVSALTTRVYDIH